MTSDEMIREFLKDYRWEVISDWTFHHLAQIAEKAKDEEADACAHVVREYRDFLLRCDAEPGCGPNVCDVLLDRIEGLKESRRVN